MLGAEGLLRSSQVAILNANYLAYALRDDYELLYQGEKGYVAHEFILDIRNIGKSLPRRRCRRRQAVDGLRLPQPDDELPVAGTLMVEPTEQSRAGWTGLSRR